MIKLIAEKKYVQLMQKVVEPGLAAMREEIDLPVEGGTLHAEVYNRFDARRAVVMVHGYTESAEKFREMAWYLVNAGYSVFALDQRGHGRSLREVDDLSIVHVDDFEQYVRDLEQFMDRVVRPRMGDAPLYLYAHSMGGAVGALALMAHPDWFAGAALNAPMIKINTGKMPFAVAEAITKAACAMGKEKARTFISGPFDAQKEKFETSHSTSPARFEYYKEKRIADARLQTCSMTYGWMREALGVTKRLLEAQNAKKIKTPVLLLQAALDSTVLLEPQDQFVSLVEGAKLYRFEQAKHEIYACDDGVLREYLQVLLGFFEENGQPAGEEPAEG